MAKKNQKDGTLKFEEYYFGLYKERWTALKSAMLEDSLPVSLSDRLVTPYYMDKASIIAANLLPVENAINILDMCAAPGGKTLVLALKMNENASLISNDRSAARRNRLLAVLEQSLEPSIRNRIKVTGYDSTKWSLYQKNTYDCILLDAPCSSERHVIKDNKALMQWGINRPKQLAIQQFAMLAAALDAVKPDGYILYSTCSINPLENNQNIEKLFRKREGMVEEIKTEVECAEKLSYGSIIMPDTSNGLGPLYFCLLKKCEEK